MKVQIDSGKAVEEVDVDVDFRLTTLKSLHSQWLISLYNHLTSERGTQIINKGCKRSRITGIIDGSTILPPEYYCCTIFTFSHNDILVRYY